LSSSEHALELRDRDVTRRVTAVMCGVGVEPALRRIGGAVVSAATVLCAILPAIFIVIVVGAGQRAHCCERVLRRAVVVEPQHFAQLLKQPVHRIVPFGARGAGVGAGGGPSERSVLDASAR
jgi:hypothetical protein